MRTTIASIILGALAVLLLTSTMVSSLVSLHFLAKRDSVVVGRIVEKRVHRLVNLLKSQCASVDCNWSSFVQRYADESVTVYDRQFQVIVGDLSRVDGHKALVQDAFTSRQAQQALLEAEQESILSFAYPVTLESGEAIVILATTVWADNSADEQHKKLVFIQLLNVFLILAFGVYLMRRTVIAPISVLERWVKARQDNGTTVPAPELSKPLEIARLRNAFVDLVENLESQRLVVQDSQARLAQTQQQLAHRERLVTVGRVASGIAHEVGNPLSSVIGFLAILKSRPDYDQLDLDEVEIIERMDGELERVRKAIRQLLDLSYPVSLEPEEMSLRVILKDVETLMKARTLEVRFETTFRDCEDFVVYFDRGLLIQVLSNLYINAVEAMSETGTISVEVARGEAAGIEIIVRDEGHGIQPQIKDGLFDAFKTTKRDSGGTGLGLSISKSLLESAGGTLQLLEPQPPRGAAFKITIPG
ncbi:MAG: sensor histidine kinase [Bradymonadia bacterium]